jgi:hypothetical protein
VVGKIVVAVARERATAGETQQLLEEIGIGAQTEELQRKLTEEKKQFRSLSRSNISSLTSGNAGQIDWW